MAPLMTWLMPCADDVRRLKSFYQEHFALAREKD